MAAASGLAVQGSRKLQGIEAQGVFFRQMLWKGCKPYWALDVAEHFCTAILGVFVNSGENTR